MKIEALKPGTSVGFDTNILLYHFAGASQQCTDFLVRCERQELKGFLPFTVFSEALHRLMIWEATSKQLITGNNPARRLRQKPELIRRLVNYTQQGNAILRMGFTLLMPTPRTLIVSHGLRERFGLLVNDSVVAASFLENNIEHMVSADDDFDRVDGLRVVKPTDL
jgi:predicted nucleic acid-binding protein